MNDEWLNFKQEYDYFEVLNPWDRKSMLRFYKKFIDEYPKPWAGLTSEDMKDKRTHSLDFIHGARWAEEKLKERNT